MRVVFMGTPEFAVPTLERLAEETDLVAVFTRPDAISGRGKTARPSAVKTAAVDRGVPVFQPPSLRDAETQGQLAELRPDLLVVAAYGLILPQAVLDIPPLGPINIHASLLPRWRGAAPIQRAILAGDAETGVSIMRMEAGLDTGPYCRVARMPIGDASTTELTAALAVLGATTLSEALPDISSGTARWIQQEESLATYADKVTKADVAIGPELTAQTALRHIRASSDAAPCRIAVGDRRVTVISATHGDMSDVHELAPGTVRVAKAGVLLGVSDGAVLVTRLKPEGKGEMAAADWARGVRDLDVATWNRP